jgi:hypothetical protein
MACGRVVIVSEDPATVYPALRKQWYKLIRKAQKEQASTLNAVRKYEMSEAIVRMLGLRFTTKWPPDGYDSADVYIVTANELLQWAPECKTLYVTSNIQPEQLHMVTSWMAKGALVVECRLYR